MADDRKNGRLPPPAFPPGRRRQPFHRFHGNSAGNSAAPERADGQRPARAPLRALDEALISPDDPLPPRRDPVEYALILPDDPLPERSERDAFDAAIIPPEAPVPHEHVRRAPAEPEEGIATGIGDDPHLDPAELAIAGDPHVAELVEAVTKLAAALERKGEAGLEVEPTMTRFEAQLRAYCVGYLTGRRAEAGPDFVDWGESGPAGG
ncbi:MAG TPA: hypothetical protein VFQ22_09740 [Longimicrobiales bacterium]|nr:hypothetical protein [Longimicrobiales bacterium]